MNKNEIRAVIDAYELGLASFGRSASAQDPFSHGSDQSCAWNIGADHAKQLAQCLPSVPGASIIPCGDGGRDAW